GFKENVPLIPYYVIETAEEDGTSKAYIRYCPDNNKPLDAFTGKPSSMEEDYMKAMDTENYSLSDTYGKSAAYGAYYDEDVELEEECADEGAVPAGSGSTKRVSFTEEEKLALLKSGDYLSKAGLVEKLLKDKYLGLTDKYVLSSAEFRIDSSSPSGYSWDMNFTVNSSNIFKQMNVCADAASGSILSFYKYSSDQPKKAVDVKAINKAADAALKYYLPDIADEFKPDENNTAKNENTTYKETERYLTYDRYHEGIVVTNNSVYISVNSDNEIMSFNYSYDRDVEFDSPDIISTDAAYASLFGQRKFGLEYDGFTGLDGTPFTYLHYSMDNFTLDAKTGKLIESTKTDRSDACPYTDISGNWSEKYIRELYRYNIRLSADGTAFKPDEIITEGEFAALLDKIYYSDICYRVYGGYYYDTDTESTAGSRLLTKAMSAKLFVMARGADDYASLKGIYKTPFKDVKSSRDDIGYIALAYALGGAKADKDGNFNPESKVTRGYAMYLIYSIISNSTKK
ncbi:MAG: S-layer homology domain-containing protein, partial [Oscillospiraceae bacterium]|nr:S-layer homology domain-containing protein [Oscillospiraceae bacterium]